MRSSLRYDCEFILWNLVLVGLKWRSPNASDLFSVHAFWPWLCIRVSVEFKARTHRHISQVQAPSAKSESPELKLWILTFLKCHRKRAPSTYAYWVFVICLLYGKHSIMSFIRYMSSLTSSSQQCNQIDTITIPMQMWKWKHRGME